jgi:hypothetical protein
LGRTENADTDKFLKFVLKREMDIIKLSTDWARAEVFLAKIVWLSSVVEMTAAIGFWYWGQNGHGKSLYLAIVGSRSFPDCSRHSIIFCKQSKNYRI